MHGTMDSLKLANCPDFGSNLGFIEISVDNFILRKVLSA